MRHRLLLPLSQHKPGNAPAYYRRIHAENQLGGTRKYLKQEFGEAWYEWISIETPISQLPLDELARASRMVDDIIKNGARAGAQCRQCDWGIAVEQLEGLDTIAFLLPEFQGMRELTRMTMLQTRLAIAEQRYDDALDLMRVNYRMGSDTAEVPFLVCNLIAYAMIGITNSSALDLMAATDSPNLYWALGELPDPMAPIRESLRFEMSIGLRMFPMLADAETAVRAPEEWNRLYRESQTLIPQIVSGNEATPVRLFSSLGGLPSGILGYTHAKGRLIDWGYEAEKVEQMAVGQVLAIYSSRVYRMHADDMEKTFYVPFGESVRVGKKAADRMRDSGPLSDDPDREIFPLSQTLLPAIDACRMAEMRVRREVALLRAIEALRMHAAEAGALPETLAQVKCVPVPRNPATQQPFQYTMNDGLATFVLPTSDGVMHSERRYEIRLASDQ